jgi:hypothetical protein
MSVVKLYEEQQKIAKAEDRLRTRKYKLKERIRDIEVCHDEIIKEQGRLFRVVRANDMYAFEIKEVGLVCL